MKSGLYIIIAFGLLILLSGCHPCIDDCNSYSLFWTICVASEEEQLAFKRFYECHKSLCESKNETLYANTYTHSCKSDFRFSDGQYAKRYKMTKCLTQDRLLKIYDSECKMECNLDKNSKTEPKEIEKFWWYPHEPKPDDCSQWSCGWTLEENPNITNVCICEEPGYYEEEEE